MLCDTVGVSRSGYYTWRRRREKPCARARANRQLTERIRQAFITNHRSYGSPRIAEELGCVGSRNRIARLMQQAGIWARQVSK